ncbi:MAG TPA: DPP IV N-terminal domain-containing protein [Longimicrobiales bacterium]|nr:DPP IV N-terminal domain-containing protein [Longimicrobiales bacterium]
MRYAAVLIAFVVLVPSLSAQEARQLTADDYARAERFLGVNTMPLVQGMVSAPAWLDGGRVSYRVTTPGGFSFMVVDPARGSRAELFDLQRMGAALAAASGGQVEPARLPPQSFRVSKDGRTLEVPTADQVWRCDLQTYACAAADTAAARNAPPNSIPSPDGRWAAFIRDHNLWARDLTTGRDVPLTTDGIEDFGYATDNAGWLHSDRPVLTWSADSRKIATFQHDGRGVNDMYLVSTNVGSPRLEAWKYPLPGDSVIFRISRVVIDLGAEGGPQVVRFQMPPDAHRSTVTDHVACNGNSVCDLQWYPDGSHIAFVSSSRDHKQAWFRIADAGTGAVRTLFEERSETQIGDASLSENLWKVLPASNELIWWSQRDNWIHLYLYDLATGRLKNRITTGDGNVTDIVHVDERARTIYFMGQGKEPGRDPYFQHLYRIGFDGRNQRLLTPENAHHVITPSPDGRHFIDGYSTPDTPPVTVLRDRNGRVQQTLERADLSGLAATGWKPPTPVRMKGRDGQTDIYGLMFTPTTLDSTRRYPIINYIYPGPQAGSVGTRSFTPARGDHQALAELGFIVVAIDGMGTPGRSKAFHDTWYGRMSDNTVPDQVTGMRQLAERYPFIDLERVGIWGHSGGGLATAAAMLHEPDFFDVGISESGNHDQRNYEDDWGERYQGLLVRQGESDNYHEIANWPYAGSLKGKLFLAHGALDDNVPPYNTYLLADALMKANKDFDLLILPQARHGFGADGSYMMRRRWDYFVRHLLDAEPPKEYRIGRPRPTS